MDQKDWDIIAAGLRDKDSGFKFVYDETDQSYRLFQGDLAAAGNSPLEALEDLVCALRGRYSRQRDELISQADRLRDLISPGSRRVEAK